MRRDINMGEFQEAKRKGTEQFEIHENKEQM